jgi:hypothetical protein
MKKILLFIAAILAGVLLGLTSHIYILKLSLPILAKLSLGNTFPDPDHYTFGIVCWAYATAIEQTTVIATVYYFTADLLKLRNQFLKIVILSFILLELKGDLLRMTVMNTIVAHTAGVTSPLMFGVISQLNQWIASILLVTALVFICPTKKYHLSTE